MSLPGILPSQNLSLFTSSRSSAPQISLAALNNSQVPAAFGLCLLPHLYAVGSAGFAVYDNSYPRAYRETLMRDTSISKV
ncbi:hypothetical protein E4U53_004999, partial [Claviceps sorghi]